MNRVENKKKLRVIWIAYDSLPLINVAAGIDDSHQSGGWVQGMMGRIMENQDIQLSYGFPFDKEIEGEENGLFYFSLQPLENIKQVKNGAYERLVTFLEKTDPDIIHFFGVEMFFLRWVIKTCIELGYRDKIVVWIQGLKSICSKRNTDGISVSELSKKPFSEIFTRTGLDDTRRSLENEGYEEIKTIAELKQVFVRTDWDKAICSSVNPKIKLLHCNEVLRNEFYQTEPWDVNRVERHSIFISQFYAALKGFHMLLDAVHILVEKYPDIKIYITGRTIYRKKTGIRSTFFKIGYEEILKKRINKYGLKDKIVFMGTLSAQQMCNRYMKSHVFVSASSIENSPNSVGEAMIIGTPVVSSFVGGVGSMLTHGQEGFFYPFYETEMLAYYISKIFDDDELAMKLSVAERERASINHDPEKNYTELLNGYRYITAN